MSVNITIIGLGQIGGSMGLALAEHKDQVTTLGHDKSPETARQAHKLGAVESISYNLPAAVEKADVVVLAIPLSEVEATLKFIAPVLREDVVLMETTPVKTAVSGWVKENLPVGRHYVGLVPALNPDHLDGTSRGLPAARADLFHKAVIAITSPAGTAEGALKLAADLVALVGGQPYFMDTAEADGVMGAIHLLPALAAGTLAETVTGQPGWPDIRKLASRQFSQGTRPLDGEEPAALAQAVLYNTKTMLRLLDEFIANLSHLREEVAGGKGKQITDRFARLQKGQAQWQLDRSKGNWLEVERGRVEMPTMGGILKQQVGGLDKLFRRRAGKNKED
jgi:prephenate dehydrogenase